VTIDGNQEKSHKRDKPTIFRNKGRDKKDISDAKEGLMLLLQWSSSGFECLKRRQLIALVMKKERQEQKKHIASISLLSAI